VLISASRDQRVLASMIRTFRTRQQ